MPLVGCCVVWCALVAVLLGNWNSTPPCCCAQCSQLEAASVRAVRWFAFASCFWCFARDQQSHWSLSQQQYQRIPLPSPIPCMEAVLGEMLLTLTLGYLSVWLRATDLRKPCGWPAGQRPQCCTRLELAIRAIDKIACQEEFKVVPLVACTVCVPVCDCCDNQTPCARPLP